MASKTFDEGELVLIGLAALAAYVWWNGGIEGAATAAGGALVNAATGAVTGAVDATGQAVGLPALKDITTDPYVSRYIYDHPAGGWLAASEWSSATAFARMAFIDEFDGHAPPPGSKIAQLFPVPVNTGSISGSW